MDLTGRTRSKRKHVKITRPVVATPAPTTTLKTWINYECRAFNFISNLRMDLLCAGQSQNERRVKIKENKKKEKSEGTQTHSGIPNGAQN